MRKNEGQRVPNVVFKCRNEDGWQDVSSDDLFAGKRVVVFALPGAFTPTCSSSHLPGYEDQANALRAAGVDEIVCLSVNDTFVMDAWGREQGADQVRLIPDGNGDFSRGMGMLVDKRDLGFGERSWRYSMLVEDGVIEKMFVEPDVPGDPFEVSDADTMLAHIAPDSAQTREITVFTRKGCSHCDRARKLLDEHSLVYEEVEIGQDFSRRALRAVTGRDTTPQVFIDGKHIGGADDLAAHLAA